MMVLFVFHQRKLKSNQNQVRKSSVFTGPHQSGPGEPDMNQIQCSDLVENKDNLIRPLVCFNLNLTE